jgi:hypothetical protein
VRAGAVEILDVMLRDEVGTWQSATTGTAGYVRSAAAQILRLITCIRIASVGIVTVPMRLHQTGVWSCCSMFMLARLFGLLIEQLREVGSRT